MAEKHFYEQIEHTKSYLIPYFENHIPDFKERKTLEVGCAEAGFIDLLDKLNVDVTGIELEAGRVDIIKQKNPSLKVLVGDITDSESVKKVDEKFDLIVIRDVIEHIPDKEKA
ncbi:MAG: class I SAM-dependent methyltransferase, partial [Rhodothermaceae bacterium]